MKRIIFILLLLVSNISLASDWCNQGIHAQSRFKEFELCIGFSEELERANKLEIKDKTGVKDLHNIYTKNNLLDLERIVISKKFVELRFYSIKSSGEQLYLDVIFTKDGKYTLSESKFTQ